MGLPASICNQLPIFTSISSGAGRIVCGFILNFFFTDKLIYYQCSLLVVGLIALLGLFIKTASPLIAFIWILGFFYGNLQASVPITLRYLTGKCTLAEGISIIFVVSAVPIMLGPPIVGELIARPHLTYLEAASTDLKNVPAEKMDCNRWPDIDLDEKYLQKSESFVRSSSARC